MRMVWIDGALALALLGGAAWMVVNRRGRAAVLAFAAAGAGFAVIAGLDLLSG